MIKSVIAKFHFDASFSRSSCWEHEVTFNLIVVNVSNTFPASSQDTAKKVEQCIFNASHNVNQRLNVCKTQARKGKRKTTKGRREEK